MNRRDTVVATTASRNRSLSILLSILGFTMLTLAACASDGDDTCTPGIDDQTITQFAERAPREAQPVLPSGGDEADAKVYVLKSSTSEASIAPGPVAPKKTRPKKLAPKKTAAKKTAVKKTAPAIAPSTKSLGAMQTFKVDGKFGIVAAAVATGVDKRTPVGVSDSFSTDTDKIWAFIKVKNRDEPTTVTMVWKKGDKKMWSYDLRVGKSYAWRTWSRKSVSKRDAGNWTVEVLDAEGSLLHTMAFTIVAAAKAPTS